MKLTIGENIRNLRREKNLTQEEFAEIFGITPQSVSRWETDSCYPDMELLPLLADFFGITVDRLIGADRTVEEREVKEYLHRFQAAISRGQVADCIAIAREGVAVYPNNYALLNKLMYALFLSGSDDADIADWHENELRYDAEITALGERIRKYCSDPDIRCEATARLAFHHGCMGRREQGRALYETLPSAEHCRENNIWWGLEDTEKRDFLLDKLKSDYGTLKGSLLLLARAGCATDEGAVAVYEKVLALDELMTDGGLPRNDWSSARMAWELSVRYAHLGETDRALEWLSRCVDAALASETRPEEQTYTCTLFGSVTVRRLDEETADSRPLRVIVRDSWLATEVPDVLRETEAFGEITARLT